MQVDMCKKWIIGCHSIETFPPKKKKKNHTYVMQMYENISIAIYQPIKVS